MLALPKGRSLSNSKPFAISSSHPWASQVDLVIKNLPPKAREKRRGLDPWVRKIPLEEGMATHSCSCLENPMGRGTWRATAHRVAKSWTRLKGLSTHACLSPQQHRQRGTEHWQKCTGSVRRKSQIGRTHSILSRPVVQMRGDSIVNSTVKSSLPEVTFQPCLPALIKFLTVWGHLYGFDFS